MSISYGGDKITASDGGSLNPLSAIFRNRLIDAGFIINQRGYTSGTALSASAYAHDRWKAGASGCTYTFTQGSAGVPIVITITAGSLQQVIEGCNMPEGGTYVLSWTGTAQARFNGGTYGSSPLAVTGIVAGANTTIEFNTGTVSFPQLEVGSSATGFEYRQYTTELQLCQRYCPAWTTSGTNIPLGSGGQCITTSLALLYLPYMVTPRTTPTGITASGSTAVYQAGSGVQALSSLIFNTSSPSVMQLLATASSATLIAGNATTLLATSSTIIGTGCEL